MTKSETAAGWITFDRVEIDLAGRRVFVAGVEAPLEPKAFAVLALLAGQAGQAFTRDEILDAVWGHRHVTPGVLNRVITLVRQALGESAETPLYLHTLHGVGYRFDAVTQTLARRASDAVRPREPARADDGRDDGIDDASPAFAPATASSLGPDAAAAARPAASDGRNGAVMPKRAAARGLLWFGALLASLSIGAWFVLAGRADRPSAAASPTLVVLPLRPVGSSADESALADGLSEELITRLARIDGLRLISRTSALLAQSEKLDLTQLGQRLHVTHALEGSLRQAGQQLRIDLRLIEIPNGRTLWAQDYDRGLADVFAIQSEIAGSVARALTLKLGLANASGESDPQLFRDYLQLRSELLAHPDLPDYEQLTVRLRALAARAPGYARAHGLLARTLLKELRAATVTQADSAEAAREAARALELDPDQIEAHAARATLACRATDWIGCMSEFRRVLELAPAETILRAAYGRWLAGIGYLDQALAQIDIAVASDPLNYEANLFRARVLDTIGRHDEARATFDATLRLVAGTRERLSYARWYNSIWRHDFVAAREAAADMPAEEHFREAYLAATEALIDPARWPPAQALIEASERATGRYNFLRLLQPNPDMAKVIGSLETTLETGSSSYNLLLWNPESLALRHDPAFQDFLKRTHIIDYWRSNGWPPQCKPDGDGAVCS